MSWKITVYLKAICRKTLTRTNRQMLVSNEKSNVIEENCRKAAFIYC